MLRWLPTVALAALVLLVSPLWRWSRGWGWSPAAMVAMGLVTVVLFTFAVVSEA